MSKAALRMERLYEAARKVDEALPELVDQFLEEVRDPELPLKERVSAFRALMSVAQTSPRMEDALGLRDRRGGTESNPLIAVIADKITVADLRALPTDERQKLLLAALGEERDKVQHLLDGVVGDEGPEDRGSRQRQVQLEGVTVESAVSDPSV